VLPLCILPWVVRSLEIHALGDDPARTLGVALNRTRLLTLVCAAGCAAVAVSIAGPVGFVGLLAPNLLRAAGIHRLRRLLLLSALWGAVLLLAADTLMIMVDSDGKLLLGVVVALAGTPLLMVLIHRSQQLHLPEQPEQAHGGTLVLSLHASMILLVTVLAGLFFIGMWAGLEPLSPARWMAAFAGADPIASILLDLRMPRMLIAAVGGALLAASGALLQSVVRNPLAGPELLGITQGAGLFTLAGLIVWPTISRLGMFGMALTGSVTVLVLILSLNRRHRLAPLPVALTGLALGALCAALSQWLIVHYSIQPAQSLVWLAGATYGRSWDDLLALLPWLLLCLPLFVLLARPLDLLALGDQTAAALGVGIGALRTLALALATLVAGAVVAVIGPVAFVGLITPHIARSMGFHAHRQLLPVAMLLGAVMLVLADLLGRTLLAPREVPAGVLTALFGAPYFLLLMVWRERGVRRLS
jgi:ABC-type Fe3+-siderophore transport system permease subunit